MKYKELPVMAVFSIMLLHSCDSGNNEGYSSDHHISQEDAEDLSKLGRTIVDSAQSVLKGNLMKAIQNDGAVAAIKFCNTEANGLAKHLEAEYDVSIKRVSEKNRNPENTPSHNESNVLKKFSHGMEEGKMSDNILLSYADGRSTFYTPILVGAPCLTCHGSKDEMQPEIVSVIDSLYPDDKAFDYKTGDIRGLWAVTFQR